MVSVVIPTRDRASLIVATLNSVLAQMHRPIEVILVDDGSTDDTRRIVEEWKTAHDGDKELSFNYVYQKKEGVCRARNRGWQLACGEFIQFFDSDDLMLPQKLSRQVESLRGTSFDFASCDLAFFRDDPELWTKVARLSRRSHTPLQHVLRCALNTHAPLFRAEALERVGPWAENLPRWNDMEFTFRALAIGLRGVWLDEILYLIREHSPSITGSVDEELDESCLRACVLVEQTAEKHGLADKAFRNAIGRRLVNLSCVLAEQGRWEISNRFFREAWRRLSPAFKIVHFVFRLAIEILGCRLTGHIARWIEKCRHSRETTCEFQ